MAHFCIPANFKTIPSTSIDHIFPTREVYGSLCTPMLGSGRKHSGLPIADEDEFREYVQNCRKSNLEFSYTLNFSCCGNIEFEPENQKKLVKHIEHLVDAGVRRFTIAAPSIIEMVEKIAPNASVTVSAVTGIDSKKKAEYFSKLSNVTGIYIHESLNRQPKRLKEIINHCHAAEKQVGTIINSFCLLDCPFRGFHYNHGSHDTYRNDYVTPEYYGSKCGLLKLSKPEHALSAPWIRPNDIHFYSEMGIDFFKVSGREMINNGGDFERVVDIYNNGFYDDNLMDLFMCFSNNIYREVYNIHNSPALDNYFLSIFNGHSNCGIGRCSECGLCKSTCKTILINQNARNKWAQAFKDRIAQYTESFFTET